MVDWKKPSDATTEDGCGCLVWRSKRVKDFDSGGVASTAVKIRAASTAARGSYEDFPLLDPPWCVAAVSVPSPSPRLTCGSLLWPSE